MAISGVDFWDKFLTILEDGTRTSSVQYYLPNEGSGATAQSGEWANVITKTFERTSAGSPERIEIVELLANAGFWRPTDKLDFWINQEIGPADVQDLENAAEERFPQMFDAEGTQTNIGTNPDLSGTGNAPKGVMSGGQLVKVKRSDGTSYFGIKYDVQGIEHLYSFESEAAARQAVGELAGAQVMDDKDIKEGNDIWLIGDAASLVGSDQNYNVYFDGIMGEASLEAGIRNPGMLGRFAADKDIMRIIAESEAGDWSNLRTEAEVRRTDFYLEVLYPGIDKILETGIGDPETEWTNYSKTVESTLDQLGYARDDDGSYRSKVGELLGLGIKDERFVNDSKVFIRAEQTPEFANILDQWVQNDTGKSLSFDEWFDVLAGTSSDQMQQIVEKATIQFQAQNASLVLNPSEIARIAKLSELSETAVGAAFGSVEQTLLALGDTGLQRYGLNVQKLVDATLNIGEDNEATRKLARKTIKELGLADDDKAQFFTGFTQRGTPVKTGLLAGTPEAG